MYARKSVWITLALTEACKNVEVVKMESDTMGACDHPTIGQPQRLGRFGSTLCYPASETAIPDSLTIRLNFSRSAIWYTGISAFDNIVA